MTTNFKYKIGDNLIFKEGPLTIITVIGHNVNDDSYLLKIGTINAEHRRKFIDTTNLIIQIKNPNDILKEIL